MTNRTDPMDDLGDLLDGAAPPAVRRLVASLNVAGRPATPPGAAALDAKVAQALSARTAHAGRTPDAPHVRRAWGLRSRLVALAAALALALGSVGGYMRLATPPASAQAILHHAAALALAPGEAAHLIYSIAVDDSAPGQSGESGPDKLAGRTLTADVWIQAGADGAPAASAQTLTVAGANGAGGTMGRYVGVGSQTYAYDPSHNAILLTPEQRETPSWVLPAQAYLGASVAQQLAALAARSPGQVKLLPQQALDGHTVDVIQVDGWADRPAQRTIFYFDDATYQLRGFDAQSDDPTYPTPSWQARLISAQTGTAVPAGTFTLGAPSGARIVGPQPDLAVLAAACHSTVNPKDALTGGTQTLLAACQATAPSMTAAGLVAALIAPYKAALDAATAASQITTAQASSGLAAQQAWLTTWVTTPGGGHGS